eukprot:GCRY01000598.1.p1 GENE.GCRY01000598.1~~GCRY01000598.1.p1  ORF type:complete len:910 (-),score=316.40 GCRY01000598.1:43-2772(-)
MSYVNSPLYPMFYPKSVAVVGASEKEGSVGKTLLKNLVASPFGGTIYPVNPKRPNVLGIKAYPSIKELPETPDLVAMCTPAKTIPALVRQCVERDVPAAIVISAGFVEMGEEGHHLVEEYQKEAAKGRIRILGPNCLGLMSPVSGVNATFAACQAPLGNIAFISQSGALCTGILDWAHKERVGFSHFISIGSMIDVQFGDLLTFLGEDPTTKAIIMYMESTGNAREFLAAARSVALRKPIIVIKAGRTAAAAAAAASHTGTLAGADSVLDAAFERAGVLRVDTINDLFQMSSVLSKQPTPLGKRLCILTNAGGPAVLATDALCLGGGELSTLSKEVFAKLNSVLPAAWSRGNPVDILGDAKPEKYAECAEILAEDDNIDGMLIILTPQDMTDPTGTAQCVKGIVEKFRELKKPLLTAWMGADTVAEARQIFARANVPCFEYPDMACRMFNYMWKYGENLQALYGVPAEIKNANTNQEKDLAHEKVSKIIEKVRKEGRTILTEAESKEVIYSYGIPTCITKLANTPDEAVTAAKEVQYPVVVKLNSETVTHKSDVGGVILNVRSDEEVRKAYETIKTNVSTKCKPEDFQGVTVQRMVNLNDGFEVIAGSTTDSQFGPVLVFGVGGTLVEVFKDSAIAIPPLNDHLAKTLINKTKISTALKGVRGKGACDIDALSSTLVKLSELITEHDWIAELDINPMLVSEKEVIALDARVLLHEDESKKVQPVIRTYPRKYVEDYAAPNGAKFTIRPIRPEDEKIVDAYFDELDSTFVEKAVKESAHTYTKLRAAASTKEKKVCIEKEFAARQLFFGYYDHQIALVALQDNKVVGMAHFERNQECMKHAQFNLLVKGVEGAKVGSQLLKSVIKLAKSEGCETLACELTEENKAMRHMLEKEKFTFAAVDAKVNATLKL